MKTIVLASSSPYRRALLERLGLPFVTARPHVDERIVTLPPRALVGHLAERKARAVADQHPDALIIGSDQVATVDDDILTQPGSAPAACAQLRRLAGRTHELLTGLCVLDAATGQAQHHLDTHQLSLRALTDAEIADYVRRDAPLDCAGSYKIEGLGISLMARIEGQDFTAITGLPLMATTRLLAHFGAAVLAP